MSSRNTIKTVVLLAGIGGLLVLVGRRLFGGTSGLAIGLLLGLGLVGGSYWFSDTVAIKAARAVPVTEAEMPEYYAIVRDLTERAQHAHAQAVRDPRPPAQRLRHRPQSRTTPPSPSPRASSRSCTWDELRGVLAHEISHVGNRDILIGSVAAALAMAITFVGPAGRCSAPSSGAATTGRQPRAPTPSSSWPSIILAPIAAVLLQMALSRSREYEADRSGARLIGDGEPLARALAKLERGRQADPDERAPRRRLRCTSSTRSTRPGQAVPVQEPVHDPPADRGAHRPAPVEGVGSLSAFAAFQGSQQ